MGSCPLVRTGRSLSKAFGAGVGQRQRVAQLAAVAGRHGPGQEDADAGRVDRRPLLDGQRAERDELTGHLGDARSLDLVDVRVDAVGVALRALDEALRDLIQHRLDLGVRVVVAPGDQIVVQEAGPDDLGKAARRGAPEEVELEQPVLGDRVAHAEPAVVLGLARDRRDADSRRARS